MVWGLIGIVIGAACILVGIELWQKWFQPIQAWDEDEGLELNEEDWQAETDTTWGP